MKPGVSLIKRLRYRRWSIAAIIPLSLLVLELYEHRPEGLASLRPEFLAEILIGLILLLMVGVPLTKIAPTSVASIKTRLQPTSRSKKISRQRQKRIVIVKNDHLLGTGIEHLLRNEADLNVEGVTAVDEPTLVEEIVRTQPDIVITEKAFHGYEPAKLLFLIKEIPKLQLIIVSAAHNLIQVYEKDQILVTHAGDLLAIVRANRNLLRGRVKEAKPDSTRKIG